MIKLFIQSSIVFFSICYSCFGQPINDNDLYRNEEIKALNDIFLKLFPPDNYKYSMDRSDLFWELKFKVPWLGDVIYHRLIDPLKNPDELYEEFNNSTNPHQLMMLVGAELDICKFEMNDVNSRGENSLARRMKLEKKDSAYSSLIDQMYSYRLQTRSFDKNDLINRGPYAIEYESEYKYLKSKYAKYRSKQYTLTGIVHFSRIIFNSEMNKACLTYNYWCGILCSSEVFVLLKKRNNSWEVYRTFEGIVS